MKVEFEYRDDMSRGQWRRRSCVVRDVGQAIDLYGLGRDCEYRILAVDGKKVAGPHKEVE